MKTPPAIPTPITSQTRIAPSTLVISSLFPCEPVLERREREVRVVGRPVHFARQVDRGRRTVDQRREVGADRRRELGEVSEVRRDVGEVLDRVGVITLAQERADDPVAIPWELVEVASALADRAAEIREVAVLVPAVNRMVPADEVEQLVAGRELDLAQPLVRLDPRGELDLIAVRIEPSAASGVRADDPAASAEGPNVVREPLKGTLDENVAGSHVQVDLAPREGTPE